MSGEGLDFTVIRIDRGLAAQLAQLGVYTVECQSSLADGLATVTLRADEHTMKCTVYNHTEGHCVAQGNVTVPQTAMFPDGHQIRIEREIPLKVRDRDFAMTVLKFARSYGQIYHQQRDRTR